MFSFRFNHVFLGLMVGAFLCAFVAPGDRLDSARLHAAALFNPISYPIHRLAQSLYRAPAGDEQLDSRSREAILTENDQLRQEVARLSLSVQRLQKLELEQQQLGNLQAISISIPVAQSDAAGRDTLLLKVPAGTRLLSDEAVIFPGGLAGRLEVAGGAARVRLITDDAFALTGTFYRLVEVNGTPTPTRLGAPLVKGDGRGRLEITGMTQSEFSSDGIQIGDWVLLDDASWPKPVQGVRVGRIISAKPSRQTALFMDIRLAPATDLTRLGAVWVVR